MHGETVLGGLVAFSLLKKVAAYGIARYYGFPRLYRKMARLTMRAAESPEQAARLNTSVKNVFRFPNRVATRLNRWRHGGAAGTIPVPAPPSPTTSPTPSPSPSPSPTTTVSGTRRSAAAAGRAGPRASTT